MGAASLPAVMFFFPDVLFFTAHIPTQARQRASLVVRLFPSCFFRFRHPFIADAPISLFRCPDFS